MNDNWQSRAEAAEAGLKLMGKHYEETSLELYKLTSLLTGEENECVPGHFDRALKQAARIAELEALDRKSHDLCCEIALKLGVTQARIAELERQLAEAKGRLEPWKERCKLADKEIAGTDVELSDLRQKVETARETLVTAKLLVDSLGACHICQCEILVDEGPIHCENCSYDCEGHEEPNCTGMDVIHATARRAIEQALAATAPPAEPAKHPDTERMD